MVVAFYKKQAKSFIAFAANGIFLTAGFSGEVCLSLMPRRALTLYKACLQDFMQQ